MFVRTNNNPKGRLVGDCVIRACSTASNVSWDDCYTKLCEIGLKKKRLPNDERCFMKYLKDNGFELLNMKRNDCGDPMTVDELIDYYDAIYDSYSLVIHTKRHLTCVVDGVIYDTWNTSHQKSGYYFFKKGE